MNRITFTIYILIWLAGVVRVSMQPTDANGVQGRPDNITINGIHSLPILENLTAMAPHKGYAVLNVFASQCRSQRIKLLVKSCDGEKIQRKTVQCGDLVKGKLICLSLKFKEKNCVTVDYEEQSSGQVELPPFSMTVNAHHTSDSGWSRTKDSSKSIISMNKYEGAYIYKMKLKTDGAQGDCSSTSDSILDGKVEGNRVYFSADWTKLDKKCTYLTNVTPFDHCLSEALSTEVTFPDLEYFEFPDELTVPLDKGLVLGEKAVHAIIGIISLVAVISLISLLWTCRLRGQALARMSEDAEEPRDALQKDVPPSPQRKVLFVYARDVADKVAHLTSSLQNSVNCQIIDLYDKKDVEKLADGAMWLSDHFLDKKTSVLLVVSEGMKELQALHSASVESCKLCAIKAPKLQASGDVEERKRPGRMEEGTEVFHFLLIDAIHKIREYCFKQNQTPFYQVVFGDAPTEMDLTPDCLYSLPGHHQYLVSALNRL